MSLSASFKASQPSCFKSESIYWCVLSHPLDSLATQSRHSLWSFAFTCGMNLSETVSRSRTVWQTLQLLTTAFGSVFWGSGWSFSPAPEWRPLSFLAAQMLYRFASCWKTTIYGLAGLYCWYAGYKEKPAGLYLSCINSIQQFPLQPIQPAWFGRSSWLKPVQLTR